MSKKDKKDLLDFLKPFDGRIVILALSLRDFIWELYPECNELIYDNYNAVAIGWSPTLTLNDIFCSIAIYGNKNVHFGFYWGSKLGDPMKMLLGNGKQYRYIKVQKREDLPEDYLKDLVAEAHINSLAGVRDLESAPKGKTVVKSISSKKRRPTKL